MFDSLAALGLQSHLVSTAMAFGDPARAQAVHNTLRDLDAAFDAVMLSAPDDYTEALAPAAAAINAALLELANAPSKAADFSAVLALVPHATPSQMTAAPARRRSKASVTP